MYVDLERKRVRVQFSHVETMALISLAATIAGYIWHSESRLADVQTELDSCRQAVRSLAIPQGASYALPSIEGGAK